MSQFSLPKKIALIGYGLSHQSLLPILISHKISLFVSNSGEFKPLEKIFFQESGIEFEEGGHSEKILETFPLILVSPGVDTVKGIFPSLRKKGAEIIGDIELFYRFHPEKNYFVVTGSNGKTTVTELLAHFFSENPEVITAGNVGRPLFDYFNSPCETIILELSSFQIETLSTFLAKGVILTNLQADHLDRYPDLESYFQAKLKILSQIKAGGVLIVDGDCPEIFKRWDSFKSLKNIRGLPVSFNKKKFTESHKFFIDGENKKAVSIDTQFGQVEECDLKTLPMVGLHNLKNGALALSLASFITKNPLDKFQGKLSSFKVPPHRLELLPSFLGRKFINDSKATCLSASLSGLNSLEGPMKLICGGKFKGDPTDSWLEKIKNSVEKVYLFGAASQTFAQVLSTGEFYNFEIFQTLDQATFKAWTDSKTGETILFSPGCSSYDQFKNYEERGRLFKEVVEKIRNS